MGTHVDSGVLMVEVPCRDCPGDDCEICHGTGKIRIPSRRNFSRDTAEQLKVVKHISEESPVTGDPDLDFRHLAQE